MLTLSQYHKLQNSTPTQAALPFLLLAGFLGFGVGSSEKPQI